MSVVTNGNSVGDVNESDSSPIMQEVGLTGLVRMGGYVYEEFLPQLQGKRATQVWLEMRDNDPVCGAILFAIDKLVRQVKWRVDPAGDELQDEEDAQFLEECMNDMSHTWAEFMSEILSMLPFGWAYHEICYKQRLGDTPPGQINEHGEEEALPTSKYSDGRIGWRKMPIRAQETLFRWEFDEDGGIQSMVQQAPPSFQITPIPIQKALLFRTSTHKNNPEGRSIFRNAYRPWYFKKLIEENEGIGIQRDLAGFPVMYIDPKYLDKNAPAALKDVAKKYEDIIRNIRRDQQEGLLLPAAYDDGGNQLFKLELLSSAGQRQFNTSEIIQRYDTRIAGTVLADWLFLGHEAVGSFALSSDKTNLFSVALGAWLDMISSPINNYAVPRLFSLNGKPIDKLPLIKYGDIESPDLAELAAYITALANAGVPLFPNDALLRRLLEVANLPVPTDDEKESQQQLSLPGMTPEEAAAGAPGAVAKIDELIDFELVEA